MDDRQSSASRSSNPVRIDSLRRLLLSNCTLEVEADCGSLHLPKMLKAGLFEKLC